MAFPNYYVGSTLDSIGRQMTNDRQLDVASQEQARLQQAALLQALQQRRAQEQQNQQFMQELALRQRGQEQQGSYQNMLMALKQREFDANLGQGAADNAYRYAALDNALKQIEMQSKAMSPQAIQEIIRQQGIGAQKQADRELELNDLDKTAEAKAAYYNSLLDSLYKEADNAWTDSGKAARRERAWMDVLGRASADSDVVAPDPVTKKFKPVLRGVQRNPAAAPAPAQPPTAGAAAASGTGSAVVQAITGQQSAAPAQTAGAPPVDKAALIEKAKVIVQRANQLISLGVDQNTAKRMAMEEINATGPQIPARPTKPAVPSIWQPGVGPVGVLQR